MVRATSPFIAGRVREQASLLACLDAAIGGRGRLAIVSGEAGLGRTTLTSWLAEQATQRGVTALAGGCYDLSASTPYGPWLEIARAWQRANDNQLPASLAMADGPARAGGQAAFFEDVIELLRSAASERPLLLILEDLHWADDASLDLLRVVAREARALPIALLVTWRTDEAARDAHLYRLLPALARETDAERVDLQPLDQPDIEALVRSHYAVDDVGRQRLLAYLARHAGAIRCSRLSCCARWKPNA